MIYFYTGTPGSGFQSTLPQGERLTTYVIAFTTMEISIHAPARGATLMSDVDWDEILISIHAPARGATDMLVDLGTDLTISIHAPARGATDLYSEDTSTDFQFQSTLPQGERRFIRRTEKEISRFQSTLPQGERRRDRRGGQQTCRISIHAPARGATCSTVRPSDQYNDFNPRSRKGSDAFSG